jgi:predicted enzyme related to lactoylglutathione lyase
MPYTLESRPVPASPSEGEAGDREDRLMRINLTSLYVDDQRAALSFYVDVLGFSKRRDGPLGEDSWLTVVSPESPEGLELLLEPAGHPAVKPYREALVGDGIPLAQFAVHDVEAEYTRLTAMGVAFTQPPTDIGNAVIAVFDDTCGNLVQLIAEKPDGDAGR